MYQNICELYVDFSLLYEARIILLVVDMLRCCHYPVLFFLLISSADNPTSILKLLAFLYGIFRLIKYCWVVFANVPFLFFHMLKDKQAKRNMRDNQDIFLFPFLFLFLL